MAASKNTIIPASQRPDGTWRKEIRVKAGYVPPDEVARYQSKGKEWANRRPNLPPGMASKEEGTQNETKKSKNQKKNERKKQKKQQAKMQNEDINIENSDLDSKVEQLTIRSETAESTPAESKDAIAKKIKGLKKKLRQIEELENKITTGQLSELTKEQKEKVSKKSTFLDELENLELDLKLCE